MTFLCFHNKRRDKIKNSALSEGGLLRDFNLFIKNIPLTMKAIWKLNETF